LNNESNVGVLEQIFVREENNDKLCEWNDCREPATHWLVCPVCGAKELQCDEHSNMIRSAPVGVTVYFNITCKHVVMQVSCGVEPL